jgi:hypothetical protein
MRRAPIHPEERNGMGTAAANKIFFERGNIKVTSTRFETGTDSFQIRKIGGVKVDAEKRNTRTGIALVVAGVAALLGGLFTALPVLIVAGAAFTVGGAMMCFAKVSSAVVLNVRGQDVRALTSKDGVLIQDVVAALRAAMDERG